VKNEELGKTTGSFIEGLRRVFRECHRVLKDDGLLVFTFHHSKVWAWEGIGRILLDSGFYVSATPVVRSEGKSGFHSSEGNIRYDCVLVCRKMPYRSSPHSASPLQERILQDSVLWVQRTLASGMPVNEVDLFTIVMGKTIEHYTKALAGEKVSRGGAINETELCLAKALQEMAALVKKIQSQMLQMTPDWKINPIGSPQQLALFAFESREKYEN
jgi:adenine-specific DNA methylase